MDIWFDNLLKGPPGSLQTTSTLLHSLNNPHNSFKSIHIAGTNGKGSVTIKCTSVLFLSGFKVGMFISPHISDFTERIQINMSPIPKPTFYRLAESIKSLSESLSLQIGWFDIYTVIAFTWFNEEKVDWACIEVGLGGRLDNTNILIPNVSVIVSIGLDHIEILGDTIEKITKEKVGIIKPGIPCVYGPSVPKFIVEEACDKVGSRSIQVLLAEKYYTHDMENIEITLAAIRAINEYEHIIPEKALQGLSAKQPFRLMEMNYNGKIVILDVSHNPPGLERTYHDLKFLYPGMQFVTAMSISKGKMAAELMDIANQHSSKLVLLDGLSLRLIKSEDLLKITSANIQQTGDIEELLPLLAKEDCDKILLITGSFYIMSQAYNILNNT
ncbi:hypothetical protein SteCoe_20823 [Stentor coeruleus]|uniref:Mur ligase central domain-containing protein n=1 Tax=Stentor coeruleus TaxID=5963 RepID=A0A1R2BR62_9CILI|nr:hypothetical protein SteCoe_20823 [Stentor coeruleus]